MSDAVKAPGWDAIDRTLGAIYPAQLPHQFTSNTAYELDKASPLPAVTVWEASSPRSWHYVSYGLSELFYKESPIPDVSGFGIELTLRLPRAEGEEQPPAWGVRLLQALGLHCLHERAGFDSGHCIDLGSSITPDGSSKLTGLVCIPDPMLRKIGTPHGALLFLEIVGVYPDELAAFEKMDLEAKVGAMGELDAAGMTDPNRESWFTDDTKSRTLRRYQLGIGLD